jgi:hypothetical protein
MCYQEIYKIARNYFQVHRTNLMASLVRKNQVWHTNPTTSENILNSYGFLTRKSDRLLNRIILINIYSNIIVKILESKRSDWKCRIVRVI